MIRLLIVVLVIGGMTAWILKQNMGTSKPDGTSGTLYQEEFDKARGVENMIQEAAKNREADIPDE